MKIGNTFVQQALANLDSGVLQLENVSEIVDRSIPSCCSLEFTYNEQGPRSTRGSLVISGVKTVIKGLRIQGLVTVCSNADDVQLVECVLMAGIRLETGARNVELSSCEIFASGRVAITVSSDCSVELATCDIRESLVGVSVSEEFKMCSSAGQIPSTAERKPACTLRNCQFEGNGTDIVVCMTLRSGQSPDDLRAVISPFKVLDIKDFKMEELTVDASISGRFENPITFKTWPLDLERFRNRTTDIPRRGFRSNKRMCHLTIVDESIIVNEDPFEPAKSRRKRKERHHQFSFAEVHYSSILGLEPGSEGSAVGSAFRRLALLHHPDKHGSDESFISIKKARDELTKIIASRP
jgi:hypothetical protein